MVTIVWNDGDKTEFKDPQKWSFDDSIRQFKITSSDSVWHWLNLDQISQIVIKEGK